MRDKQYTRFRKKIQRFIKILAAAMTLYKPRYKPFMGLREFLLNVNINNFIGK